MSVPLNSPLLFVYNSVNTYHKFLSQKDTPNWMPTTRGHTVYIETKFDVSSYL